MENRYQALLQSKERKDLNQKITLLKNAAPPETQLLYQWGN